MSKKLLLPLLLTLLIFALGIGIAFAQRRVSLVFRQGDPVRLIGTLPEALKEFEKTYPNIKVEMETVAWGEAFKQFVREIQAGGGPDLIQIGFVWTRPLAKMGGLLNLDPYIKKDFTKEKYDDWVHWEIGEYKGSLYGVPWTADSLGLVYREDLFKDVGLEPPDTWTEALATAIKLTKDKNGDGVIDQWGIGLPGGFMWFNVAVSTWSHNVEIVEQDPKTGKWRPGFDNLAGENIIRYWYDFLKYGATPKGIVTIKSFIDPSLLNGIKYGDYAMIFLMGPWAFVSLRKENPALPVKAAFIPGTYFRYSMCGGRELAIPKNSKYVEEAWELLKFLTQREIFEKYYPHVPPQKSIIQTMKFPWGEKVYADMIITGRTYLREIRSPASLDELWDVFNREYSALFAGQKTIAETHKSLVKGVEEALRRGLE